MQPHQQRVVDEKAELDSRHDKLRAFLMGEMVKTLPADEHERLSRQYSIMIQYSNVLGERIAAWG